MPKKNTAPKARAKTNAAKHEIPLGLQLAIRSVDYGDSDPKVMKRRLTEADVIATTLLRDTLVALGNEGANAAVADLAKRWGAEKEAQRLADVIPESATHDPHSWITACVVPWLDAALYIGLSLGFRIGTGFGGTQGGGR